jgi:hypothetical protein
MLAGEAEALTRKAVELALVGAPTAMRLCLERILPRCREYMVKFALAPIESALTGQARGLKAHDVAGAMKAVTSALAGGMITPGEAATIAAELAMPDLDQIKQGEQGCGTGAGARGRSGNPAGRPRPLVVDSFVRAIETSDFERRLQLVEADSSDHPGAVAGMYGAG